VPTVAELDVVINANTAGFDAGLKHVETQTKGLGDSLSSGLGMGLGFGVVTKGIELIGSAFMAAKGSVIDLNSSLEQSKIAFTTMLGGAEQAESFLAELQTFAANTPFEFPDLVTASKRMLAFGFESKQVVPLLTAVGDAVAAVGGGADVIDGVTTALGQMQAKGKVSAEEMGQLAERGIPAWDMLAKKLGTDVPTAMDMVSKGAVKAGTFIEAFQEGVSTRFGGMMEKQALTFSGAMSTIGDSLQMAIARGFKPFFDLLSAGAVALSHFVQSDTFNRWADGVATTIERVAGGLRAFGQVVLPIISDAWNTVVQVFERDWSPDASVDPLVNLLGLIATVLRDVVLPAVSTVTGFIVTQFGVVVDWFNANLPLIQKTVETVFGNIERFWDVHGKTIVGLVTAAWTIISTIWDVGFKNLLSILTLAMQLITGDWGGAWTTLGDILTRTWAGYGTIIKAAWDAIVLILDAATGGAMTRLTTWLGELGTAIGLGWDAVKTTTETAWTGATGIVSAVAAGWDAVTLGTGNAFMLPAGIVALTSAGWASVVKATTESLTTGEASLVAAVTDGWGQVVTYIEGLGRSGSALLAATVEVGASIVTSIRDGISGALDGFWSWLQTNFVDKIPAFVKTLLDIKSPSGVFADIGRQMVEGLRVGMESRLPSIDELIERVVGKVGRMSGDVDDWLRAAMSYTGAPASWLEPLKWIVSHESGGDPRAKNPDSTAAGLFQMIDTTWAGSRDTSLPNDIFNPVINAIGGIRYIRGRYGDPFEAVDFWKAHNHYASGGWAGLHGPEMAMLGERGPEYVIPNHALRGGIATESMTINVAVGGRVAEQIYVEGRDLAIRRGRAPAGA
jgi:tape measure domain-containing protein